MTRRDREALMIQVALLLVAEAVKNSPPGNLHSAALLASEAARDFVADLLDQPTKRKGKSHPQQTIHHDFDEI